MLNLVSFSIRPKRTEFATSLNDIRPNDGLILKTLLKDAGIDTESP